MQLVEQVINQTIILDKYINIYGTFENPLFLAKDVAEWLGNDTTQLKKMLDKIDDEEKVRKNVTTPGGIQNTWFITEDGLYEVLMLSRKPIAKQFRKQIKMLLKSLRLKQVAIVNLPSYQITDPIERALAWIEEEKVRVAQQKQLEEQADKVEYYNNVIEAPNGITVTQISKSIGLSAIKLNKILNELGIQFKQRGQWVLYHKYQDKGYTVDKTRYVAELGETVHSTLWTEKGKEFIINTLKSNNII